MKKYHAHVYFDLSEMERGRALYEKAKKQGAGTFSVWRIFDRKVGPHAKPMFEMHFEEENKEATLRWINQHRGSFSVLVHEDSGDDVKDHEKAIWLGEELPIDFSFFQVVQANPFLSIH